MVEGDVFREVEEELRRERLNNLWRQYSGLIIAGAIAIVGGVAGYKGWQSWSANRAAEAGAEYESAAILDADGKSSEAIAAFNALAENGPSGYQVLAKYRLAAQLAADGNTADAVAAYDALSANSDGGQVLQSFARIRAAMLRLDTADWTEMENRLNDLTGPDSPWRFSARELMGMSAYRNGRLADAERILRELSADPSAPRSMLGRVGVFLALIAETSADKDSKAEASDTDGEANNIQ